MDENKIALLVEKEQKLYAVVTQCREAYDTAVGEWAPVYEALNKAKLRQEVIKELQSTEEKATE